MWASAALAFASLLLRILTVVTSEDWFAAAYYGTLSRGSGILMGAALAAWLSATPAPRLACLQRLRWPCVIGLVTSFVVVQQTWTWTYTVFLPVVDTATVILLLLLTSSGGVLRALLELRVLQYLGRVSYGLYLWQLPVIWFAAIAIDDTLLRMSVQLALPFALAALTYTWVEIPALRYVGGFSSSSATPDRIPTSGAER